jgi:hypothetical protein
MTEETKKRARKAKPKYEVVCDRKDHLKDVGFDFDWLNSLASEYDFNKFEYLHKFRAFRCYKAGQHVDWININDVALLNGKRRLEEIKLKHQPVSPKRAVINYPWR